ncbi:MAG: FG-GAP-like repeat-containing protein, partial [Salibacteraceae bacterium]
MPFSVAPVFRLPGIILILVFGIHLNASGAVFTSVQSGDWDNGATWGNASPGTVGVDFPAPSDSVFIRSPHLVDIDFTTSGSNYQFNGYLQIDSTARLQVEVGSNSAGFILESNGEVRVYGSFYSAGAGQGPGTATPTEKDLRVQDNALFYIYEGATVYVSDDIHADDNAIFFMERNVCVEVDDDFLINNSTATVCGTGSISIGPSNSINNFTFNGGSSTANVCSGITVYRANGSTCTGPIFFTGTGPACLDPTAVNDTVVVAGGATNPIMVLTLGTNDSDIDSDILQITSAGSNGGANNLLSAQGFTLAINNNGTPSDFTDDFIDYTPSSGFSGSDSFVYTITDTCGNTDQATVSITVFAGCGAFQVEVFGTGAAGLTTATLNLTDSANMDSLIAESVFKSGNTSSITYATSAGQNIVNNTSIPTINPAGNRGVFQTNLNPTTTISATTTNASATRSLIGYVYRSDNTKAIISIHDVFHVYLFKDSYTRNITIPAGTSVRNIKIVVPVSELNPDGRSCRITASAGGVTEVLETFTEDLGNSLKLFTIVLEDVPASATSITLEIVSSTSIGDSFIAGGAIIDIQCTSNAPEAVDDVASTVENNAVVIDVLANDSDADNNLDPSTVTNLGLLPPSNGSVTVNPSNGNFTYTPDPGFTGTDNFQYIVCDQTGICEVATVYVDVVCSTGQFVETANAVGLDIDGNKDGGLTWADFNNDGAIDVLVNTDDNSLDSRLYFSDGGVVPNFTDVTATNAAGLLDQNTERTAIAGDLNNDGNIDFARNTFGRIEIYLNQGSGSTPAYSFGDGSQSPSQTITSISGGINVEGMFFIDWDNDNDLDLVLDNHNFGMEVFENNGSGSFTVATPGTAAGQTGFPESTGGDGDYGAAADFDNDGFVDLILRKSTGVNLWRYNPSTSRYESQTNPNTSAANSNKGSVIFCDFDNDGDLDIFWTAQGTNQIWRNNNGTFVASGIPAGAASSDSGIDECDCADVDNDGDLDLFLGDDGGSSYLFINNTPKGGSLSFTQNNLCIDPNDDVEGSEFVDFDHDGDMDLYMNINGDANQLWKNIQNDNNYLLVDAKVRLSGGAERYAFGSNVMLSLCGGTDCGIREVSGGRGHGSQRPSQVHFGLGANGPDAVYKVTVFFVDSAGVRDTVSRSIVPSELANQTLIIYRGDHDDTTRCVDYDEDGIADAIDLDDDNDGILDVTESGGIDATGDSDNDGVLNYLDSDFCTLNSNGVCANLDLDGDGVINQFDLDSDNDGITDLEESGMSRTDITALDSDNDGIIDNTVSVGANGLADDIETNTDNGVIDFLSADTDGDGFNDSQDLDSDNDGITDLAENGNGTDANNDGIVDGTADADNDGMLDSADGDDAVRGAPGSATTDTDADGTPNHRDLDSDNDGITDLAENGNGTDADNNGIVDGGSDADSDGILDPADSDDANRGTPGTAPLDTDTDTTPNYLDLDSDNDGITDLAESGTGTDADNNGIVDGSSDADKDGILDSADNDDGTIGSLASVPTNTDGDCSANFLDFDSDNDGITDLAESGTGTDADNNGIVDGSSDADNDGVLDSADSNDGTRGTPSTEPTNTDGDGVANYLDLDSDNDGITDLAESGTGTDADNNGIVDGLADSDSDGILNSADSNDGTRGTPSSIPTNTDSDGVANYLDLDSDNDGITDLAESGTGTDSDNNGIVDGSSDSDSDGILDSADSNDGTRGTPSTTPTNSDADGVANYLDLDSDNDGITDLAESGTGTDADNNGIVDGSSDTDTDGILDSADSNDGTRGTPSTVPTDTDTDNVANFLDLDSDNDGIFDLTESGSGTDADNDGEVDGSSDNDSDGILDSADNNDGTRGTPGSVPTNSDTDGLANYVDLDSDADGIIDLIEAQATTGTPVIPSGNDTDGDGLDNNFDTDNGGVTITSANTDGTDDPDYLDTDSDNDGSSDLIEAYDLNNNGIANTSPSGNDTDGDGLDNSFDNQGTVNATTNPTNGGQDALDFPNLDNTATNERDWREINDLDGDGIADALDLDTDNDGIPDANESNGNDPFGDEDGDGILNFQDNSDGGNSGDGSTTNYTDSNGDGIPDVYDTDGDGVPNHADLDSDNDGIPDLQESGMSTADLAALDADNDGVIDNTITFGNNGLANDLETSADNGVLDFTPGDTDSDGVPDSQDLDSDNDGISDLAENDAGTDAINDGVVDGSTDADGDGILDSADGDNANRGAPNSNPEDTDGDGVPDLRDLDSDNDGITDLAEAGTGTDANNDGVVDGAADNDGDGILDSADSDDANRGTPGTVVEDTDNDGTPDFQDLDSDNDGITDLAENGNGTDANNDGIVDGLADNDGDGILDAADSNDNAHGSPSTAPLDTDNDGRPNFLDLDSDNDGITDLAESGTGSDINNDGLVDGSADNDGDGIIDSADSDDVNRGTPSTVPTDTDSDNIPDAFDLDSDNDGIADLVESGIGTDANNDGIVDGAADNDGDGILDSADNNDGVRGTPGTPPVDTDNDGTPYHLDLDSDNDGITDLAESGTGTDSNNDGVVDGSADNDGDGILDSADSDDANRGTPSTTPTNSDADNVPDFIDLDSDNDGITDLAESGTGTDSNNDGVVDGSADNDGDGILDSADNNDSTFGSPSSAPTDSDNDGFPDSRDLDSDNDGIFDLTESGTGTDANNDGEVDGTADNDGDGILNSADSDDAVFGTPNTPATDTDSDGFLNSQDIDSDGDGLIDLIEAQATTGSPIIPSGTDTDGDGLDNNFDTDNGGTTITPVNTDGADNPDYLDTDSDNDGLTDTEEAYDTDNDGTPNTTASGSDTDGDGLDNSFDNQGTVNGTTNPTNNGQDALDFPNLDTPATNERDWREGIDTD